MEDGMTPGAGGKRRGLRPLIAVLSVLLVLAAGLAAYDVYGPGLVRYTISFDSSGGSTVDDMEVKWFRPAELPVTGREGYDFAGWTSGGDPVSSPLTPNGDMALTAMWEAKEYTVTFDHGSGADPSAVTLRTGDALTLPDPEGEVPGHRFVCWADPDGNEVADGTVLPYGDVTLKAVWDLDIEVRDGVTYIGGILIANKTYQLPSSYAPGGLTDECYSAFQRMKSAAAEDGISLRIVSGYRSYSTQYAIYWRYVGNDGMEEADTYSARPGHSEHQSGLAMDLNSLSGRFADTAEGKWLAAHCHEYGFIIRYPRGKQEITGYIYEPWHVRYLGVDVATSVYESGLCLEEYLGITSEYQIASAYEQYGRN